MYAGNAKKTCPVCRSPINVSGTHGKKQPKNGIAYSVEQSRLVAADLGLPLVVRPSYVLGGRAMALIHDESQFDDPVGTHQALLDPNPEAGSHFLGNAQRSLHDMPRGF